MGSRIRENVKHFFECFCEVVPKSGDKDAWIIQKFPDSYKDEDLLKSVPKFAYPCYFENNTIQHYSFVLTDIESKWTFGFCRHDPKTETALVVLSYLPWHQAFYKFLNNIAVLLHSPRSEDIRDFLQAAYKTRVPESGLKFEFSFNRGESCFTCECPDQFKLPSIPENRNLTEYYNAVDTNNMMQIFAAMLNERRIIFTSRKLYRLSACVQSANDIIYPMIWQHIFIPVLPTSLVDYLLAPMPFLIGVPHEVWKHANSADIGEVVVLDADTNIVVTPFDDLNSLPPEIVSSLKRQLRNRASLLGDGVSRAFLRCLVQLIGGYRDALDMQEHKEITFNPKAFIESRPATMQPFLHKMLQLQIFQQFIEERLQMLNKGLGFTDEFEMETHRYAEKSSSKLRQQYKEWTYTMKREGTAFFKQVKDKANPAVKSAVKSVKESGKGVKSAYKGLKSKLQPQGTEEISRGMKVYMECANKPRSAPSSPTTKRRPVNSLAVAKATYRKEGRNFMSAAIERPYSPLSPVSNLDTPDSPDRSQNATPGLEIPPMDLLHELHEIFNHRLQIPIVSESPPIDRSLKPVRSFENFRHASSTVSDWTMSQTSRPKPPIPISPSRNLNSLPIQCSNSLLETNLFEVPPPLPKSPPPLSSFSPLKSYSLGTNSSQINRSSNSLLETNLFELSPEAPPPLPKTSPPLTSFSHQPNTNSSKMNQNICYPTPLSFRTPPLPASPPPLPTRPPPPKDLFGSLPFVVGGGQNENGDTVFLVASENSVDMVKLSPPCLYPPRRKLEDTSEDLIRLDAKSTEMDYFDPLLTKDNYEEVTPSSSQPPVFKQGLTNPVYSYYTPGGPTNLLNGNVKSRTVYENTRNDQDLLEEYGLNFNNFNTTKPSSSSSNSNASSCDPFSMKNTTSKWTTFE